MKKISFRLIAALLIISQMVSVSSVAFAEEAAAVTPAATATTPATAEPPAKPVELSSELSLFMEVLFVQFKAKAYAKAYATTAPEFKKNMKLDEFTKFANAARLIDFTEKKWVDKQWNEKTGLIVLRGEFTANKVVPSDAKTDDASAKETHLVTFDMKKKGDTYEILGITETLSIPLLAALFPKEAQLQAMIEKDLRAIAKMTKGVNFRRFYNTMSKKAQKNIKYSFFAKAMKAFKKEKKDVSLPKDVKITVDEGFPIIDKGTGDVTVKGEYATGKYVVLFSLGYNYEWEWKLNSLSVNPVPPEKVAEVRAEMAAAVKKAQDEAAKKAADDAAAKKAAEDSAAAKAKAEADAKAAAEVKSSPEATKK